MGVVWRGRHVPSGRAVAFKWLRHDARSFADLRREARVMARLDHAHLLAVHDLGHLGDAPDGLAERPCLVMAFADGGSLAPWRGRLTWAQCVPVLRQLLDGLAHLGARGLVHQDIKPANILLTRATGGLRALLGDFGVGRTRSSGPRAGTLAYLGSEVAAGGRVGPWTDLFALGRTTIALLAGDPDAPLPDDVPDAARAWLARLIQTDPSRRPSSAAEALHLLGPMPDGPLRLPALSLTDARTPAQVAAGTTRPVTDLIPSPATSFAPKLRLRVALPPTWGQARAPRPPALWQGMALWRMRRPPMVGRVALRTQIWAALQAGADGPALCILAGAPGVGTSRLVEWAAETAHARGGRLTVHTHAAETPTVLGEMLDALDPLAQQQSATLTRVRARRSLARRDLSTAIEAIVQVARAAGPSVWCLDGGFSGSGLNDSGLNDGGLDDASLIVHQVARAVLASDAPACVIVATRPGRAAAIARALGRPAHAPLAVPPLDDATLVHLLRQRLRIASPLAERIVGRIPHAPGVALHLLDTLTPQLIETPAGLNLPPDVPLPSAATDVWRRAIDALWRDASPAERDSLVALAVLSPAHHSEWAAVCAAAGLPLADALLDRFADADLLRLGDPIVFVHAAVTAAILVERPLRVQALHRLAADARTGPGLAKRRARVRHALECGDVALALQVLEDFAEDYASVNDLTPLLPLITEARRAVGPSMTLDALEARVAFALGDRARAAECLGRVQLDAVPSVRLRFAVVETQSLLHLANGAHKPADALVSTLYAIAAQGDAALALRATLAHARTAMIGRQHATVIKLISTMPDDTPPTLGIRAEIFLQDALVASGQTAEAIARLDRLFAVAVAADSPGLMPHVEMYAGNAYLHAGDAAHARVHFERALALDSDRMPASAYFHLNLAILDLQQAQPRSALDRIESLAPRFSPWPVRIGQLIDAVWLQAVARVGQIDRVAALLDRLEVHIDADVAADTRIAIEAALDDLEGDQAERVRALLSRMPVAH